MNIDLKIRAVAFGLAMFIGGLVIENVEHSFFDCCLATILYLIVDGLLIKK